MKESEETCVVPVALWVLTREALDVARDHVRYLNTGKWTGACARRIRAFERHDAKLLANNSATAKRRKLRRVK